MENKVLNLSFSKKDVIRKSERHIQIMEFIEKFRTQEDDVSDAILLNELAMNIAEICAIEERTKGLPRELVMKELLVNRMNILKTMCEKWITIIHTLPHDTE